MCICMYACLSGILAGIKKRLQSKSKKQHEKPPSEESSCFRSVQIQEGSREQVTTRSHRAWARHTRHQRDTPPSASVVPRVAVSEFKENLLLERFRCMTDEEGGEDLPLHCYLRFPWQPGNNKWTSYHFWLSVVLLWNSEDSCCLHAPIYCLSICCYYSQGFYTYYFFSVK